MTPETRELPSRRLAGKVIVVTGAAGFIGSVAARQLHDQGALLLLADKSSDVEGVAQELNLDQPGSAVARLGDITDASYVEDCISSAVDTYGHIDCLWNNAAALDVEFLSHDKCITDIDPSYFQRALEVNTVGAFLFCKYAIVEMVRNDRGAILNTSSIGSTRGDEAWSAYGVSKAALNRLTLDVATQYGPHGIRANNLILGSIANPERMEEIAFGRHTMSEYQLLKRVGSPEDVGNAAIFLLSDESAFITAASVRVDGGINAYQPWLIDRRRTPNDEANVSADPIRRPSEK